MAADSIKLMPDAGRFALALVFLCCALVATQAAELIATEDFNTDGEGSRYTTQGRGVVPGLDTTGPAFWARNVDVTALGKVVGVPAPAPARRAALVFNHALTASAVTPEALQLIDATIKWLTDGKTNLKVLFSAAANPGEGDQLLVQRLTDQGHTVTDDEGGTLQTPDGLPDPATIDLVINGSSAGEPARLAKYAVPLLTYRAAISGDLLVATRGETGLNFDPGEIQIQATNHPIATGLPAKFTYVTEAQPLDTIGLGLPAGATTIATYQYTDAEGVTSTRPLLVVIEKGVQMLGGLISGFEGAFWGGADLNEPTISNDAFGTITEPRTLTLRPVNVAGKSNVKMTIAMAGTDVDFDFGADDFLRIMIDTDGDGPGEFTALATFAAPSASEHFYTDGKTRLGVIAKDITYDIPAGATDLVIRFEGNSTFWNEIVAFDNVRVHTGDLSTGPSTLSGLLGYWRMNETNGTAVSDWSGKNHPGTIINSASGSWVTDAERGAVYRATGTNVIAFGTILPAMSLTNDFTWSLWLNSAETGTAAATDNNIVFGNRYNTSGADFNPREFIKFTPSQFEWHVNALPQNIDYTDFTTNKWTHHVVVKKGTSLNYYRDGVLANSTNVITAAPINPQPLYLGGQGAQERWRGLADEVAIFDRALSATEVQQAFDLGKAGQPLAPEPLVIAVPTVDAANLTVTWTGGTPPFKVQARESLSTGSWADVGSPTNNRTASVPRSGATGFVRIVGQ